MVQGGGADIRGAGAALGPLSPRDELYQEPHAFRHADGACELAVIGSRTDIASGWEATTLGLAEPHADKQKAHDQAHGAHVGRTQIADPPANARSTIRETGPTDLMPTTTVRFL